MSAKLSYAIVPVTPFEQNCSVIWCNKTKLAAVVDPGGDLDRVTKVINDNKLTLDKILITHAHLDHAGGTAQLARSTGVNGFQGESFEPDQWLEHGDTVELGELSFDVAHCPGHTPGHVVFIERSENFAAVGDVLFNGSQTLWLTV